MTNHADPEVRKMEERNARLRVTRDKSIAVEASGLLRQSMSLLERMEPEPGLTKAVGHLCKAVDALCAWEPKGGAK